MRAKADVRRPAEFTGSRPGDRQSADSLRYGGLRAQRDLLKQFNLIWVVQCFSQKYSGSLLTQITSISATVSPHRGAYRDRHGREAGCDGRERRD
jgi:hypothetical protein